MDACANLTMQKDASAIAYRLYEPTPDLRFNFHSAGLNVEHSLRERGHIVCYDPHERAIWYFRVLPKDGETDDKEGLEPTVQIAGCTLNVREESIFEPASLHKARLQPQLSSQASTLAPGATPTGQAVNSPSQASATTPQDNESKASASSQKDGASQKLVYENFIIALLQTMSSSFCTRTQALPLDYRTVLLPDGFCQPLESQVNLGGKGPKLGSFRAYITTTGALVVGFSVVTCRGFESLEHLVPSSPADKVVAAPFGVLSSRESSPSADTALAPTPGSKAYAMKSPNDTHLSFWRQACLNILHTRGVLNPNVDSSTWASLPICPPRLQALRPDVKVPQNAQKGVSMPWPGSLCFRKRVLDVPSTNQVGDTIGSGHIEAHDPLALAKSWFSSATEREEKITRRRTERAAAQNGESSSIDSRLNRPNPPSPLAMRQQGTGGGSVVYPTPPDALQHLSGVTPSMDGNLSSPGHPLSATNPTDMDTGAAGATEIATEDDQHEQDESRPGNGEANLLNGADPMFEDIGGDMFDDNDITDADFNFFDEEPAMQDVGGTNEPETDVPVVEAEVDPKEETVDASPVQIPIKKEHGVFAKPELKHARSSQIEEAHKEAEHNRPLKRSSSPFDPHTIFKRVRASILMSRANNEQQITSGGRRPSKIFEKVDFDPRLPMLNKKYEHGGLYDYSERKETEKAAPGALPQTNYLKRHGKSTKKAKERPPSFGSLLGGLSGFDRSRQRFHEETISDDEDSSSDEDDDDDGYLIDDMNSPMRPNLRISGGGVADAGTPARGTPSRDMEQLDEFDDRLALELPRLLRPDSPEISLQQYFIDPEPFQLDLSLSDEDLIQVAQLVTEQAAIGNLSICFEGKSEQSDVSLHTPRPPFSATKGSMQILQDIVSSALGEASPLKLRALLNVQDVPLAGQTARVQPRAIGRDPNAEPVRPSNLYQIPSPHLEVRRSDAKLSVLPSAVSFWESLGLAPSSGAKDVNAVCVFQGWAGMADNARTFLGRLKSMYETLKLGTVQHLPIADQEAGLLQYEVDKISTSPDATLTGHGSAMVECMETLRSAMSSLEAVDTNVVVYFVYSPRSPGTIVEACAAFQRLFDTYQTALAAKKEMPKNELVLQLVSADIISSPTGIIITPNSALSKLCMETYDRCTIFGAPMPAPAIRLEQPLPRIIDFKLSNNPSASLIRENSCIHVAYAISVDKRWVSAAWTDDRGNEQATASYCFGRKGKAPSRTMNDIANEIWESTLQLISVWKIHWRVVITKCGPMEASEAEFWMELARTEIHASVTMILMTVNTNPSLQLVPPSVKLPPQSITVYTTPVSTPQPSIVSPEAMVTTPATPARDMTAATPTGENSADPDSESVLADVTDQTWGAISSHRLSNSTSTLETHPAFISGYLVKRTGSKAEDAPVVMEVNLVHTEAGSRAYEPLLREMLSYFRSLGTLARARGVVETEADVRPWHIAAAEKAVRALYLLM